MLPSLRSANRSRASASERNSKPLDWWIEGMAVFSAMPESNPACTCAVANERGAAGRVCSGMQTIVEPRCPGRCFVCRTVARPALGRSRGGSARARENGRVAQLITPAELDDLLRSTAVRVLDVRERLDHPDGSAEHLEGHVPGAVYVDMETELSQHGRPDEGRHPLPPREALQAAARRWGIDDGDTVVVYDDDRALGASRAWWLLTRSGIADVRLLDGGLGAWTAAGLPLESGPVTPEPGAVSLAPIAEPVLSIDEAAALAASGVLIDVRAAERYRGEVEPIDPIAGHIPGAVNLPTGAYMEGERFRDAATLRALFATVGAGDGA